MCRVRHTWIFGGPDFVHEVGRLGAVSRVWSISRYVPTICMVSYDPASIEARIQARKVPLSTSRRALATSSADSSASMRPTKVDFLCYNRSNLVD